MMSLKGDGKPVSFIEDCAVPLEHLAEYTAALTEVFARHGTRGTWYAHASVGTLHVRPILDMRRDGAAKMRAIAEEAAVLVRKFKGAYSGEHGDGLCRGEWIRWQFGPKLDEAFRAIKRHLDPDNLFCPNRIVDPPKMDDASLFRFAPATARSSSSRRSTGRRGTCRTIPTTEAISAPGSGGDTTAGFAKAVEMCNNNGHCRKFDAGTMCPSYRVTRDEQHLTRGRANTLRLALSGQLGPDALTGDAVHEALDLCVGCKGCKRDCPTGVDMARMKFEVQAQRAARTAPPEGPLIGRLPDIAPWASRMPWLFNLRNRSRALARVDGTIAGRVGAAPPAGVAPRHVQRRDRGVRLASRDALLPRTPPARTRWCCGATPSTSTSSPKSRSPRCRCCRPPATRVHVARGANGRAPCCGRTHLAAGDVDRRAPRRARCSTRCCRWPSAASPIVGLEPSCLLTLRDEYLVHGPGRGRAHGGGAGDAVRGVRGARDARGPVRASGARPASRCWCTAIATRRRSA